MDKLYDVIIVGAGPIGLFLACELRLAGASVLILERDAKPDAPWKVDTLGRRGLNSVSLEAFHRRGLLEPLVELGEASTNLQKTPWLSGKLSHINEQPAAAAKPPPGPRIAGHFAGILLSLDKFDLKQFKYRLPGPSLVPRATSMGHVETVLTERAESLGNTILRGHGFTRIVAQDDAGIMVEAGEENASFRGRWLVACDGGRSAVRKAAGFEFAGTGPKFAGYVVDCEWASHETLSPGFHYTSAGAYSVAPNTLYITDFENAGSALDQRRREVVTHEHVQGVLDRMTGSPDARITLFRHATTFTDQAMQATRYRQGRVLIAGDAAHIHSPLGAQGLNLGIGDAINLGWKLAASCRAEAEGRSADLALLDTYGSERRPLGAWMLDWGRAQSLTLQPDAAGAALRGILRSLISTTDGTTELIGHYWGMSHRYTLGGDAAHAHPLVGMSAPDFEFADGARLGLRLQAGRGLLVDFDGKASLRELIAGYEAQFEYLGMAAADQCGLRALLIRADGVVAWVAEDGEEPDTEAATAALKQWFRP